MSDVSDAAVPTPRQQLASFVWTLFDDLDYIVSIRSQLFGASDLVPVVESLGAAWADLIARREEITTAVLNADISVLELVGLTGTPLTFKLTTWRWARGRLVLVLDADPSSPLAEPPAGPPPPPADVTPEPRLRRKIPRLMKAFLKRLAQALSYADELLGSLTAVVKLSEPLKELKGFIEKLAGDTADALPEDSQP